MHPRSHPAAEPSEPLIAIAGAGFSGTMVAVHLLRMTRDAGVGVRIALFDPHGSPGRGTAFSSKSPVHLLNVRAGSMSAFADDAGHFLRWAQSNEPGVGADSFLPRALYGRYVSQIFETERMQAPPARIQISSDEIVGAEPSGLGLRLTFRSGSVRECSALVLATGHALPAPPVALDSEVRAAGLYRDDPWGDGALEGLAADATVMLLGSGLTAVDVLLEARRRGLRGPVQVLSRRGLLPMAHAPGAGRLSRTVDIGSGNVRSMLRRLRNEIDAGSARGESWQSFIDALRSDTQRLWRSLGEMEQRRFLRHVRPYWDVHRHRLAPQIAALVREELASGRTTLLASRVLAIAAAPNGLRVTIAPRGRSAEPKHLAVDRLVNCTGPNTGIAMCDSELTRALLGSGVCAADPLGIGLATDPDGAVVDSRGTVSDRIFTLGPLRKGDLWESTAVPEIRVQAEQVARRVVNGLAAR